MAVLITGASGFVGHHLARALPDAFVAGRSLGKLEQRFAGRELRQYQPLSPDGAALFAGVETVVHLAGESVFHGRWTHRKKKEIHDSRVQGTRALVQAMRDLPRRPACLVCASAVGFYGDRGDAWLDEDSVAGDDFLALVCRDWEAAARQAETFGVRVVMVRTGVVLGRDGGALPQMLPVFRWGMGGRLGHGHQFMPWIHIDDLVRIYVRACQESAMRGPVNAVAPEAVTNRQFTHLLAKTLARPALFPVPALMLRLVLGEFATVLLASQRVRPRCLEKAGFRFRFPGLALALADLLAHG